MTAVAERIELETRGTPGSALVRWGMSGCAVACWTAVAGIFGLVWIDADKGLFLSDEAFYLMAAAPQNRGASFNGFFGWYLGPVMDLFGWNIGATRRFGLVVLTAAAVGLGIATARAVGRVRPQARERAARWCVVGAVLAAALLHYGIYVRTLNYNWMAAVGVMTVATALLRLTAESRAHPRAVLATAALIACGLALTTAGKVTSGAATALVVAVALVGLCLTDRRVAGRVGGLTALIGLFLVALHLTLVQGLGPTVSAMREATVHIQSVDPARYSAHGTIAFMLSGIDETLRSLAHQTHWVFLLPLTVLLVPRAARSGALTATTALAVAGPVVWLALTMRDGRDGYHQIALPTLSVAGTALVLLAVRLRTIRAADRRLLGLPLLLAALTGAYVIGSNVEFSGQVSGGLATLVAGTVLVLGLCLPDPRPILGLLAVATAATSLFAAKQGWEQGAFYYAPEAAQTTRVDLVPGARPLRVAARDAAWVDGLRTSAAAAGWRHGTPMLDLTFCTAGPLALEATVPSTMLPGFSGYVTMATSSALALRVDGRPIWRDAWLMTPAGVTADQMAPLAAQTGRPFPQGYALVTTLREACIYGDQQVWRPVGQGLP